MAPICVGRLAEFADRSITHLEVEGVPVGVMRWRRRVFAVRDVCPHMGGPVCGSIGPGLAISGNGRLAADTTRPVIRCAWHGWEFDLESGRSVTDPRLRVTSFATNVEDGRLLIDVRHRRQEL